MNVIKLFPLMTMFLSLSSLAIDEIPMEDQTIEDENTLPYLYFIEDVNDGQKCPTRIKSVFQKGNNLEVIISMVVSNGGVVEKIFIFNDNEEIKTIKKILMGKISAEECWNKIPLDEDGLRPETPFTVFLHYSPGSSKRKINNIAECIFKPRKSFTI